MPYQEIYVPADLYLEHKGVEVFHTYKDDDYDQGPCFNWFCLDEEDSQIGFFDVRDLKVEEVKLLDEHPPFINGEEYMEADKAERDAINRRWDIWLETGQENAIKAIIIAAIDAGIIKKPSTGEKAA